MQLVRKQLIKYRYYAIQYVILATSKAVKKWNNCEIQ